MRTRTNTVHCFQVMRKQLARVEPDHIDHIEKELEDTTNIKV